MYKLRSERIPLLVTECWDVKKKINLESTEPKKTAAKNSWTYAGKKSAK
jgi:hypothetical protein